MTPKLDIDLLHTFATIVDNASFSRAALRVGRTQSALSMQMRRLEDIVGGPLLVRSRRGMIPTAQGERLLGHAREILRAHDRALTDLGGQTLSGSFRFGCPDDYAVSFLPHLIGDFINRHPDVFIEIICASTPVLQHGIGRNTLDLALVSVLANVPGAGKAAANEALASSFGTPHDPAACIRLEQLVWVSRPDRIFDRQAPIPLALAEQDTVDHASAVMALTAMGRAYRVAYASTSLAGLLAVVRSGHAIAVLTRCAIPSDLREAPTELGLPELPTLGITLASGRAITSSLVDAFATHIRSVLPGLQ